MSKNIAIFLSGKGSNAIEFIQKEKEYDYKVALLVSSIESSPALKLAQDKNIPILVLNKEKFLNGNELVELLQSLKIDLIVLAGFLWKIPDYLLNLFPNSIVNIHPSLLPKYGGKGMYGMHVHRAVKQNQEEESGISIHLVNEKYDDGALIFQAKITLDQNDSAESISEKVLSLEHQHYPRVVHELCKSF